MRSSSDNTAVTMLGVALTIIFVIVAIWYNVKHPCVEWREDTCTTTDCTMHDDHGVCTSSHSRTYPCKTCVRRQ
jgi:hypothetical protein